MQNPCLACKLKDYDKSGPACTACKSRLAYAAAIAADPAARPAHIPPPSDNPDMKIEQLIQDICSANMVDAIQMRRRASGKKYARARQQIIRTLHDQHGLAAKQIALLINSTTGGVQHYIESYRIDFRLAEADKVPSLKKRKGQALAYMAKFCAAKKIAHQCFLHDRNPHTVKLRYACAYQIYEKKLLRQVEICRLFEKSHTWFWKVRELVRKGRLDPCSI